MDMMKERIIGIVKEVLEINSEMDIKMDDFLKDYGLNSLNLVNLIVDVEECLEIEIKDEDLCNNNFRTLNDFFKLLEKY